jgi:Alginate export
MLFRLTTTGALIISAAHAQDPLAEANVKLKENTHHILSFGFEERTRWEERYGVNFGKSRDQQDMLSRLRIGVDFQPLSWLKLSAIGQDARAPLFGSSAPNTLRDTLDLQEGYLELFGSRKTGFQANFGRQMLDYGEARVIGTPQWTNVAKTFDGGRVRYKTAHLQVEALLLSPVKVAPDKFNVPDFGDRIWGTYNVFSDLLHHMSIDLYALRHSQNAIGGWSGAGTLGTNSYGSRLYGPLLSGYRYSLEGIAQGGHIGLKPQRAYAWYTGMSKQTAIARHAFIVSAEYKVASGGNPKGINSGTYDQLSPANHDKFGHQDLFGWRNLKTFRSLETLRITKAFAWNVMYSDERLYNRYDSVYNSQGSSIARSPTGTAGTHVGQELDTFLTYTWANQMFGAGFGHFFAGDFIRNTTPAVNPRYFYVFQQYTLK